MAWWARYQRYLQRLEDYQRQRTDFEQQRQAYHRQRLAYQMMREDLQRVKLEQEQRRWPTRYPFFGGVRSRMPTEWCDNSVYVESDHARIVIQDHNARESESGGLLGFSERRGASREEPPGWHFLLPLHHDAKEQHDGQDEQPWCWVARW